MKYIVVVGDGMADRPILELGDRTLLEACKTPNLDKIATLGCGGLVKTVPDSCLPGSDIANLSLMGYNPEQYFVGRGPLEAASMGIKLGPNDVAFRCNLVTVDNGVLKDYCAGHISSEASEKIIEYLQENLNFENVEIYHGVSYRHLMVFRNAKKEWQKEGYVNTTPPHDFTGNPYAKFLPSGTDSNILTDIMQKSFDILSDSPENKKRVQENKLPANMIWLWGHGGALDLETIPKKWNVEGSVISAVDLIRGLGIYTGLNVEIVEGATGYIDTNYAGKVQRALDVLSEKDFVFLHIEAPDEAGHSGKWQIKKQAIEDFDSKVIGPLIEGLEKIGNYRMLVTSDHATPIELKTHSREAVPFAIYPAINGESDNLKAYNETEAPKGKYQIKEGNKLMKLLITGE